VKLGQISEIIFRFFTPGLKSECLVLVDSIPIGNMASFSEESSATLMCLEFNIVLECLLSECGNFLKVGVDPSLVAPLIGGQVLFIKCLIFFVFVWKLLSAKNHFCPNAELLL
jgi:hypothetical protein